MSWLLVGFLFICIPCAILYIGWTRTKAIQMTTIFGIINMIDHYAGLSKNFTFPVYCSEVSFSILNPEFVECSKFLTSLVKKKAIKIVRSIILLENIWKNRLHIEILKVNELLSIVTIDFLNYALLCGNNKYWYLMMYWNM